MENAPLKVGQIVFRLFGIYTHRVKQRKDKRLDQETSLISKI